MTSPGAFTLLFFALPLPRLFTLFFLPDGVCLSLFLLSSTPSIPFPLGDIQVLTSRRFRLPTTCEGDGTAAQLYELRSRRYFAFGIHRYHSRRFISHRSSSKLEQVSFTRTVTMPEFYLVLCTSNKEERSY